MRRNFHLIIVFLVLVIGVISRNNICDLPKVVGPCNAKLPRFHYDVETGRCKKFVYGGCDGNENNFKTRQDCFTTCRIRVCTLSKMSGTGPLSIPRWFYNVEIMKCEKFIYRGGKRNKNSFRTKRKCERLCGGIKKDSCGPPRDCARPPPGTCVESVFEIINGEKCYAGCSYPRCKKGSCPTSEPLSPCSQKCNEGHNGDDTGCPEDQLCCTGGCCRDPVLEPKIGECPADPRPKTCPLKQSECQLDGQCNGKRKCCRFTCHKFCVDPNDNK